MQWKMTTLGVVLCLVAGGGLFSEYLDHVRAEEKAAADLHEESLSKILPDSPRTVLRAMQSALTQHTPDQACMLMDESVRPTFAQAHGEPTCEAAMNKLAAQVTDPNEYVEFSIDNNNQLEWSDGRTQTAFINGCEVTFGGPFNPEIGDPGPRLGQLHMRRILNRGLLVDGYTPCPPQSGKKAPTLPGNPWSISDMLVGYLANGNPLACRLFSDSGQAEFAAANRTANCPDAVAAFRAKVTDPKQYEQPIGGSWVGPYDTTNPNAAVPVYACQLVWSSKNEHPGPAQVGNMEVARAQPGAGYWITHFRPC